MLNSTGRSKDRRSTLGLLFLACLLALGVGLGLGLGVPYHEAPPPTTAISTTTAPSIPCDSTYNLTTSYNNDYYAGNFVDYYINGDTFSYLSTTGDPNHTLTLTSIVKSTNITLWSKTLCQLYFSYGQYVAVDQTTGDTYMLYQCTPNYAFIDKYAVNGTLVWHIDITNSLGGSIRYFGVQLILDVTNQQFYFGFNDGTDTICALNMTNGQKIWCNGNFLAYPYFGNMAVDSTRKLVYVIQSGYVSNGPGLLQFNATNGTLIQSINTTGFVRIVGVITDSVGNIYIQGSATNDYYSATAIVRKYDAFSLTKVWTSDVVGPDVSDHWPNRNIVYDPTLDFVILTGTYFPNTLFIRQNSIILIWVSTVSTLTGDLVKYAEFGPKFTELFWTGNIYISYDQSFLTIDPGAGIVYVSFFVGDHQNYTNPLYSYLTEAYCYKDAPILPTTTTTASTTSTPQTCASCDSSFSYRASPITESSHVGFDTITNFVYDLFGNRLIVPRMDAINLPGAVLSAGSDWTVTLCDGPVNNSFAQIFVTVNQTNGDIFVVWSCTLQDNAVFLARYLTNGTQAWILNYTYDFASGGLVVPSDAIKLDNIYGSIFFLRYEQTSPSSRHITIERRRSFDGYPVYNFTDYVTNVDFPNRLVTNDADLYLCICGLDITCVAYDGGYGGGGGSLPAQYTAMCVMDPTTDGLVFTAATDASKTSVFISRSQINGCCTYNWVQTITGGSTTYSLDSSNQPLAFNVATNTAYMIVSSYNGTFGNVLLFGYDITTGTPVSSTLLSSSVSTPQCASLYSSVLCPQTLFSQYSIGGPNIQTNISEICL